MRLRALMKSHRKQPEAQTIYPPLPHTPVDCKTGGIPMLLIIESRCGWCGDAFSVCRSCWRGQTYCRDVCRFKGYRRNQRKAKKNYRQTADGKKQHSEGENRRRNRLKKKNEKKMGYKGSLAPSDRSKPPLRPHRGPIFHTVDPRRCRFCGRFGEIVDVFPRRGYG